MTSERQGYLSLEKHSGSPGRGTSGTLNLELQVHAQRLEQEAPLGTLLGGGTKIGTRGSWKLVVARVLYVCGGLSAS